MKLLTIGQQENALEEAGLCICLTAIIFIKTMTIFCMNFKKEFEVHILYHILLLSSLYSKCYFCFQNSLIWNNLSGNISKNITYNMQTLHML